jgi:exodeoxyribonuclease III
VSRLRVVTWNVNSIRVRVDQVLAWSAQHAPDVLCLQEIKTVEEGFPSARFAEQGYTCALSAQPTYNGVAILAKGELTDVVAGFSDGAEEDAAKRLLRATHRGVRIVNCYAPNGEAPGTDKYAYKLRWYPRLRAALDAQEKASARVVLVGDMNVAPEAIDVHDPKRWEGKIHFSLPERAALENLRKLGFSDCLRRLHPEPGIYTWWDYRLKAWERGWGLRIDHVFATDAMADRLRACDVDRAPRAAERPSDHIPVTADFDL